MKVLFDQNVPRNLRRPFPITRLRLRPSVAGSCCGTESFSKQWKQTVFRSSSLAIKISLISKIFKVAGSQSWN